MPAAVIPIESKLVQTGRRACWSLLEIAQAGRSPIPYGILLADQDTSQLTHRLRGAESFDELDEQEADILSALSGDLEQKAREMGGIRLLESLEDSLSGFFRIGDRTPIVYRDAQAAVDRLFDEHVDATIRPFITHLPVYGLRAAATKFGEGMEGEREGWVRAPEKLRLTDGMFVAQVVGRSMEPLIPDGSFCIFRAPVTGSRKGRYLLIEKFDETDFAARYTVKKYARWGGRDESAERESAIRLEPLNPEFEAFDLTEDRFRVAAEFVQVLPS
ncbi:MAG TPA: S24 family peptidase [Bryobacteraceae bacterium]|jgi:SOS-response transcriptional repressor LexA|nr:S24 family peptidase [Bryobacteraceae bacterium]